MLMIYETLIDRATARAYAIMEADRRRAADRAKKKSSALMEPNT